MSRKAQSCAPRKPRSVQGAPSPVGPLRVKQSGTSTSNAEWLEFTGEIRTHQKVFDIRGLAWFLVVNGKGSPLVIPWRPRMRSLSATGAWLWRLGPTKYHMHLSQATCWLQGKANMYCVCAAVDNSLLYTAYPAGLTAAAMLAWRAVGSQGIHTTSKGSTLAGSPQPPTEALLHKRPSRHAPNTTTWAAAARLAPDGASQPTSEPRCLSHGPPSCFSTSITVSTHKQASLPPHSLPSPALTPHCKHALVGCTSNLSCRYARDADG
jgi:hypothetical protein